jgi:hypothetical protein
MSKLKKIEKCNICCKEKKISFDHVPPKACMTLKKMTVKSLLSTILGNNLTFDNYKLNRHFQNGIGYDTICAKCNSDLGAYYDVTLSKLINELISIFKSKIYIPSIFSLETNPLKLIKSILGHSLSASLNFPNTVLDEKIRPLIFDKNKSIIESINIYYYISPIKNPYALQNFTLIPNNNPSSSILIKLIHFYPITFIVTEYNGFDLLNLASYRNYKNNDYAKIKFDKLKILPYNFPSTKNFMLIPGGDSYIISNNYGG